MTHLQILVDAFTRIGYTFIVKVDNGYSYVVPCTADEKARLEGMPHEQFLAVTNAHRYEFLPDGSWGSHPAPNYRPL